MTRPASRCLCLAALALAATAPECSWAEGNRLLPFWAQPYPYGYAYRTAGHEEREPCPRLRRAGDQVRQGRCVVVLHARD